jgi:hypothetical protein
MGQFDSRTDAVLTQIQHEDLSSSPGGEFLELTGELISLIGTSRPLAAIGKSASLLQKIRRLAGSSYGSNLVYVITAVRDDLADLHKSHQELRERIESLGTDPRFAEAISALALRAMHTSVKDRLKRLARIIANGVKYDDLEPENLDDMLRAATELTDRDITVLKKIADEQLKVTIYSLTTVDGTINFPREVWQVLEQERFITPGNQMEIRSSLARLQAVGFGAEIQTTESSWRPRFLISPGGTKFLAYLQEPSTTE